MLPEKIKQIEGLLQESLARLNAYKSTYSYFKNMNCQVADQMIESDKIAFCEIVTELGKVLLDTCVVQNNAKPLPDSSLLNIVQIAESFGEPKLN